MRPVLLVFPSVVLGFGLGFEQGMEAALLSSS